MFFSLANLLAVCLITATTKAQNLSSNLTQISNFGPNPRNVSFYIYVPKELQPNPPVIVIPHWCHGTAQDVFRYRSYATLGDKYGFISIYPDSPNLADKCWDVSSNASMSHDGGGDALGIVSMVKWALNTYKGDQDRVFVTGTSSGAMMTNVLIGSYPDVFAAGSAWAGVPFGCFAGNGFGLWNDPCAKGEVIKSGEQWASLVKAAYPSYTGFRPKIQILHGTADNVLYPQNLNETIKQWTSVFGYNETPKEITLDTPRPGWTRLRYGPGFEAYSAAGVTHDIPDIPDVVMEYFDLACDSGVSDCFSRKTTPQL